MKYTNNNYKFWRLVFIPFLIFWLLGFGAAFCVFIISFISEPKPEMIPVFIMLLFMASGAVFIAFIWFRAVMITELENGIVTLTYITGKKVTFPAEEVTRVKKYSRAYLIRTSKKEYEIRLNFKYASMEHESIDFIRPAYFPNAEFVKGNW